MDRLDEFLCKRGYYSSRNKAKSAIVAGKVKVNDKLVKKPAFKLTEADKVECEAIKYVSRSAQKLERALDYWQLDLTAKVAMDIGASTGGFTQVMLAKGASKVYAIDVGSGQLATVLVNDSRVVNIENCNVRYFDVSSLEEKIDFISVDVSFISLQHILPVLKESVVSGASLICLIKPQFEVGKTLLEKNGLVKLASSHLLAIEKVKAYALEEDMQLMDLIVSPIKGNKGNMEFLGLFSAKKNAKAITNETIKKIIKEAHLNKSED